MTFDEWFEKLGMPLAAGTGYSLKDISRRAFEAGAAIEREAIVALAAAQGWAMKNEDPFEDAVREICDMRKRSNAGVTGAELAKRQR